MHFIWHSVVDTESTNINVSVYSSCNSISDLTGITYHVGSHGVTCHPMQLNPPEPDKLVLDFVPWRDGRLS